MVVIVIWIIFGMCYILGVVNLISNALKAGRWNLFPKRAELSLFFSSKPVKKAFQSMKSQIHLDDYWRKILAEVWVMKHGDGEDHRGSPDLVKHDEVDLRDGLVTTTSQTYLGEGEDNQGMEKTPSMRELLQSDNSSSEQNQNLLAVPGAVASVQDTVHSLRQFLNSAQLPQPKWLDQGLRCPGMEAPTRLLISDSSENPSGSSRRASLASNPETVSQLLEQTTLSELMVAVDNVRKKSMLAPPGLLPVPEVTELTNFKCHC